MEECAQAVVLEGGEPATALLDLLGAEVHALRGAVGWSGAVVVWDLPASGPGSSEAGDFGYVVGAARGDGLSDTTAASA